MYLDLLKSGITYGRITLKLSEREQFHFGKSGPEVTWLIPDARTIRKIAKNWEFELGETYIEGEWSVEGGRLYELIMILRKNFEILTLPIYFDLYLRASRFFRRLNSIKTSRNNVAHHYDIDGRLFQLFLDESQIYSCAYFADDSVTLEQAQLAKCRHIAAKLMLAPGQSVLDIGCGWGSLALYLAKQFGVRVTGLTLSQEQFETACRKARDENLQDQVTFKLCDYREHAERYDRIVSIGMFEHVDVVNYPEFFDKVSSGLKEEGVALIHTIVRPDCPRETNPWVEKYIFPGGYVPALSEFSVGMENSALRMTDIEFLYGHYERTLACWRKRFDTHRDEIKQRKGEKFCRMWEFYLASAEVSFRTGRLTVMQVQLAKRDSIIPLTRDYMYRRDTDHGQSISNLRKTARR